MYFVPHEVTALYFFRHVLFASMDATMLCDPKVLAAHRSGLKRVILPRANERDLEDIPSKIRRNIDFVLVGELDEVFAACIKGKAIRRAA